MYRLSGMGNEQMPQEDIWNSQGPESMWGINPEMRAAMNARNASDLAAEHLFKGAITNKATPEMLAMIDPYRFWQRTGMGMSYVGDQPTFYTPGSPSARDVLMGAARTQQADTGLKNALLMNEIDRQLRGDPIAKAISGLPQQDLDAAARIKAGLTEVFGGNWGGTQAPGKFAGETALQGTRNAPLMAEIQRKLDEWKAGAPEREQGLRAGEVAITEAQRKPKSDALKAQIEALTKIAQTTAYPEVQSAILDHVQTLNDQLSEISGVPKGQNVQTEIPPGLTAQYPPAKYKGRAFIFHDPATGRQYRARSDGKNWVPLEAAAGEFKPGQATQQKGT